MAPCFVVGASNTTLDVMSASETALAFLRKAEGLRMRAYLDRRGGVWTIGYGVTGKTIVEGLVVTLHDDGNARASLLPPSDAYPP